MKNVFLTGKKIYLRPLEVEDAKLYEKWVNDIEVKKTFDTPRPINYEVAEDLIKNLYKNCERSIRLGIVVKKNDQLIGYTHLSNINYVDSHCMFAVLIGEKDYWSKGLGTEATELTVSYAFDILNMNKVWLIVYDFNPGGVKAYEKAGFIKEGVKRQDKYYAGKRHDTIMMSILQKEWRQRKEKAK